MKVFEYLKSLIKADTLDSSKNFALVLSCIVGAVMGFCVCFCLIYDVCSNGYIKTDLDSLGIFCCASDVLWLKAESTRRWLIGKETIPVVKNNFDCTT